MDRECRSNGGTRRARNYADRPADPLRISQRIGFSSEHSRGLARRSMPNDSSMQLELPSWFNPRSADISRSRQSQSGLRGGGSDRCSCAIVSVAPESLHRLATVYHASVVSIDPKGSRAKAVDACLGRHAMFIRSPETEAYHSSIWVGS